MDSETVLIVLLGAVAVWSLGKHWPAFLVFCVFGALFTQALNGELQRIETECYVEVARLEDRIDTECAP